MLEMAEPQGNLPLPQKDYTFAVLSTVICALFVAWPRGTIRSKNETDLVTPKLQTKSTDIYFQQRHGKVEEHVVREGRSASHIYMDSGARPYMFFAFPAKNSGAGIWFDTPDEHAFLTAIDRPRAFMLENNLHGAEITVRTHTKLLVIDRAVLSNMRFVRYSELDVKNPKEILDHTIRVEDNKVILHRKSLNQLADYKMELEPLTGTEIVTNDKQVQFRSDSEIKLRIRGMTSEKPLNPLIPSKVFKAKYLKKMDQRKIDAISFLLYAEKFAAGSPRYLTQFGRDALITLYVLMETMNPEALEDIISATVSGMDPSEGHVSHEQNEGDWVSWTRMKEGKKYIGVDVNIENYKMIDDDYIFPIVLAEYMKRYPQRVTQFLERKDPRGISHRHLILNNFKHVMETSQAFAKTPVFTNLIKLYPGENAGQWRDSDAGLGGGLYPFDVNAALVPGALKALSVIYGMKELDLYNAEISEAMAKSFAVWNTKVVPLFEIRMPVQKVVEMGSQYFRDLHIDLSKLPPSPQKDLMFPGIALDAKGQPIAIMHSDDSLMMTFGYPSADYMHEVTRRVNRPFPFGLKTPVGILVSNPVFASASLKKKFDETKYHGRVSWTMQEDLLMFGFQRQMALQKLPESIDREVRLAMSDLAKVIQAKDHMGGNEVFTVLFVNGNYLALPFAGDAKSNSNQLWSHLRIAAPLSSTDSAPTADVPTAVGSH